MSSNALSHEESEYGLSFSLWRCLTEENLWKPFSTTSNEKIIYWGFMVFSANSILGLSPWKQKLFKRLFFTKILKFESSNSFIKNRRLHLNKRDLHPADIPSFYYGKCSKLCFAEICESYSRVSEKLNVGFCRGDFALQNPV